MSITCLPWTPSVMSMNLIDISILNIKSTCYHYITSIISKSEAINLMQNINLTKKVRSL